MSHPILKTILRARLRQSFLTIKPTSKKLDSSDGAPRVFVALAADYGNLGDLAITRAQIDFVARAFPDATAIELPISETLALVKQLKREIRPDDVITLIGGGNTGDMYDDIQWFRELFIREFPRNAIISFPQTVEFSDTFYGRWSRRRAARIYRRHPRLHIVCRDSRSLERMVSDFGVRSVSLGPDTVLTLAPPSVNAVREGSLLVLRDDVEKSRVVIDRSRIATALAELGSVSQRDTHVGDVRLARADANELLDEIWNTFSVARVVVTDRLHGMIFAVVTGTPCLALDSRTGKVARFYDDWLSEVPHVRLVAPDSPDELTEMAREMVSMHVSESERSIRGDQFRQLLLDAVPQGFLWTASRQRGVE